MTRCNPSAKSARRTIVAAGLLCAGVAIAWIDTRPGWDDTGMTAGLLALATAAGTLAGVPAWLAATLGAGPIVLAEVRGGWGRAAGDPRGCSRRFG